MENPEWIPSGVINRTLRVERRTCFQSTPVFDHHPPQQAEYTSSFQIKMKTFITLFEKCNPIYSLKIMKSEYKTLRTDRNPAIDGENPS